MNLFSGFGSVSASEFVTHHWERQPLHVAGVVDGPLLTLNAKRIYSEYSLQGVQSEGFTSYHEGNHNRQQGREAVLALWNGGQSPNLDRLVNFNHRHALIVRGGQLFFPELATFMQGWQSFFKCRLNANVYLTKPRSSVFGRHYDQHHVFAVQVDGEKDWFLWPPTVDAPHGRFHFQDVEPFGEPFAMRVKKGDIVYIPLGWVHRAKTVGELSVHITIGINPPRWLDLLEQALDKAAGEYSVLRKGLPFRFSPDLGMEFFADEQRHIAPLLDLLVKDIAKTIPDILRQGNQPLDNRATK